MNIKRSLNNIIKINEFAFLLIAYLVYIALTAITASDINDYLYESLTYFIFVHTILMPLYLFFVGRHDTYVNLLYCHIRFKSPRTVFFVRIIYLLVETAMFTVPYIFMTFIFAIVSRTNISFLALILCGINIFLNFLMVGIVACTISVKFRKDYLGAITAYLILCMDFMLVLGLLTWDFSFYYVPMLEVFTFTENVKILVSTAISVVKAVMVFGCAYMLFMFKKDNIE